MSWERGRSSDKPKKEWTLVINPTPVFDGPEEKRRYEDALARNPRQPGDDVVAWIERVGADAQGQAPLSMGRLPYRDPDDPDAEKEE